jgi:carboxynorspermidine decarboxylase
MSSALDPQGLLSSLIPSPCFVLEEKKLRSNLAIFERVQREAPVKVLLALKGFALYHAFSMIRSSLYGASASSLWEAELATEHFGGALCIYSPAYRQEDLKPLLAMASHLTFNSLTQYDEGLRCSLNSSSSSSLGLRINPLYSPVETALYNPCQPNSRLGVLPQYLESGLPEGIEGFLSHNLCESDSYALKETLSSIERHYSRFLHSLKWLNLGGGHLLSGEEYNVEHAIELLNSFHRDYPHLQLFLEPGSAIVWRTGFLTSTVIDLIPSLEVTHVMLDVSFTAHMPDCLEMPYQPRVVGASAVEHGHGRYRLGGSSCLSGDFIGDYVFDAPLRKGDRIIFEDMMHYTMVKSTMFNGVVHPSIGCIRADKSFELWRTFGYEDFRARLG